MYTKPFTPESLKESLNFEIVDNKEFFSATAINEEFVVNEQKKAIEVNGKQKEKQEDFFSEWRID